MNCVIVSLFSSPNNGIQSLSISEKTPQTSCTSRAIALLFFVSFSSISNFLNIIRKNDYRQTEDEGGEEGTSELLEKAGMETHVTGSEDMELNISHILEKIQHFTQLVTIFILSLLIFLITYTYSVFIERFNFVKVSELLESGKSIFKELSDEFEERMIA